MYMTSRATQYCLAGRMQPTGRRLESPCLEVHLLKPKQNLVVLTVSFVLWPEEDHIRDSGSGPLISVHSVWNV